MVGLNPKGKFIRDGDKKLFSLWRKGTHIAGIRLLFNMGLEVGIYKMNLKMLDPNYLRESI